MKSNKAALRIAVPGLAMIILILDAKTAIAGAQDGVELCIRTVVPALFPFIFLSILVTGSFIGKRISILRPLEKLCRIPSGAGSLLLVGLLGGYPVGAQCVTQAYRQGQLPKDTARRMLGFCSNAGPSFLFGMLAGVFSRPSALWVLWGIHILSALLTGVLLPGGSISPVPVIPTPAPSPAAALERSVKVTANICGWVIVFRVTLAFFQRWFFWLFPDEVAIAISGLLELTNGCCRLPQVETEGLRFLLAALFLSFGGICVLMQTLSVTQGLGSGLYFPGKLVQLLVSFVLVWLVQPLLFPTEARAVIHPLFPAGTILGLCVFCVIVKIAKIHGSNLARQGV